MRSPLKNAMRKLKFGNIFVFDIPYAKVEATTPRQANANLLTSRRPSQVGGLQLIHLDEFLASDKGSCQVQPSLLGP